MVSTAWTAGAEAVSALDPTILYAWLARWLFAIVAKERHLHFDRKRPEDGPIVDPEGLSLLSNLHMLMQVVRTPVRFHSGFPGSIIVADLHCPDDVNSQFDFYDWPYQQCISIRAGRVGVIACLCDRERIAHSLSGFIGQLEDWTLHPLQWVEATAQVFYRAFLVNKPNSIVAISAGDVDNGFDVIQLNRNAYETDGGLTKSPSNEDFATIYSQLTGWHKEQLLRGGNMFTLLHKEDGTPRHIALGDFPVFPNMVQVESES